MAIRKGVDCGGAAFHGVFGAKIENQDEILPFVFY